MHWKRGVKMDQRGFKHFLNEKIPDNAKKSPFFKLLLDIVDEQKIDGMGGLKDFLSKEIESLKVKLNQAVHGTYTMNRVRMKLVERIDALKEIENLVNEYLE